MRKLIIDIKNVVYGNTLGRIYYKYKKIYIYTFNFDLHSKYIKFELVFALFHELRHAYQYTMNKKFSNYDTKEDDANDFAKFMMKKYFKEITKILYWEYDEPNINEILIRL